MMTIVDVAIWGRPSCQCQEWFIQ